MDADGDNLRQLTDSPYSDTWISWRPCHMRGRNGLSQEK
jgi:hypothetical protein